MQDPEETKSQISATEITKQDISTNTDVQIDQSIFVSYIMHVMDYFASLGIFMHQGRRIQIGNKITAAHYG